MVMTGKHRLQVLSCHKFSSYKRGLLLSASLFMVEGRCPKQL